MLCVPFCSSCNRDVYDNQIFKKNLLWNVKEVEKVKYWVSSMNVWKKASCDSEQVKLEFFFLVFLFGHFQWVHTEFGIFFIYDFLLAIATHKASVCLSHFWAKVQRHLDFFLVNIYIYMYLKRTIILISSFVCFLWQMSQKLELTSCLIYHISIIVISKWHEKLSNSNWIF